MSFPPRARPRSRRRPAAVLAVLVAAAAMLLLSATAAQAHAVLLATTPTQLAQVKASPDAVVLTFNEMPRQRFTTVHVLGPDGARRDSGAAQVIDDAVHQALGGSRPAGTYTVDWRVISSDGHPISGQFTYTATAAAAALPPVVAPPATNDAKSGGTSVVLVVVIVVVVVLVAAGAAYLFRRRRRVETGTPVSVVHDDEDDS